MSDILSFVTFLSYIFVRKINNIFQVTFQCILAIGSRLRLLLHISNKTIDGRQPVSVFHPEHKNLMEQLHALDLVNAHARRLIKNIRPWDKRDPKIFPYKRHDRILIRTFHNNIR